MAIKKIEIAPDVEKTLGKFKDEIRNATVEGFEKGLFALQEKIPGPPVPSHKPFSFVSIRQRRWFFASLAKGLINIPYRRTNEMLRRMTTSVKKEGPTDVVGRIGTSLPYAPYVISDRKLPDLRGPQSEYHSGTWWTLQEEVEKNLDVILDKIRDSAKRI